MGLGEGERESPLLRGILTYCVLKKKNRKEENINTLRSPRGFTNYQNQRNRGNAGFGENEMAERLLLSRLGRSHQERFRHFRLRTS